MQYNLNFISIYKYNILKHFIHQSDKYFNSHIYFRYFTCRPQSLHARDEEGACTFRARQTYCPLDNSLDLQTWD
jgi:hypothetical protein